VLLTGLGFLAAIIASQALISGSYSLTRQAMQLGYFPRLRVEHTHAEYSGQIYLPLVNGLLAAGSILTVMLFHTTSALSAAYGIAVTGTMGITTIAYFFATRPASRRALAVSAVTCGGLLVVDLLFFGANLAKILDGGWFPLAIGGGVLAVMHTWKEGRNEVFRRVYRNTVTEEELVQAVGSKRIVRVPGAIVFMAGSPRGTPVALLHHLKSNRALHETAIILTVIVHEEPAAPANGRLVLTPLGGGIWRAVAHYGYMEFPNVTELMHDIAARGVPVDPLLATYVFNHEMVIGGGDSTLREWQKRLYGFLCRNARPVKDHYQIPPAQIIEIGLPVHL
jgi:KUP system potassium uptake protein